MSEAEPARNHSIEDVEYLILQTILQHVQSRTARGKYYRWPNAFAEKFMPSVAEQLEKTGYISPKQHVALWECITGEQWGCEFDHNTSLFIAAIRPLLDAFKTVYTSKWMDRECYEMRKIAEKAMKDALKAITERREEISNTQDAQPAP